MAESTQITVKMTGFQRLALHHAISQLSASASVSLVDSMKWQKLVRLIKLDDEEIGKVQEKPLPGGVTAFLGLEQIEDRDIDFTTDTGAMMLRVFREAKGMATDEVAKLWPVYQALGGE